jgi:WD40 repeat protein
MGSLRGRLLLVACLAVVVAHPAQGQWKRAVRWQYQMEYSPYGRYGMYGGPGLQPSSQGQTELRQFVGHQAAVRSVAFTPNNKFLVTAGYDKNVRVWGLASGVELRRLEGHQREIISIAVLPDGKRAVSGSFDRSVRVWDLASARELCCFNGHTGEVHHVAASPDGRFVASASYDGTVRLWGVASGKELRRFDGHQGQVYTVTFSPDGKTLASGGQDHTVRLWDAADGKEIRQLTGHTDSVLSVAFSPDGKTLASASHDTTVRLWDVGSGKERQRLSPYPQNQGWGTWVRAVAFSPDGRTLASAGMDRVLRLWEVATGKECAQFLGHNITIWTIAFSPDGRTLASASDDQTARIWDATCQRGMPSEAPSAKKLDGLWNDLGDQDATKAYRAVWALTASAEQAVPVFQERLLSHAKGGSVDPQRVARLIAALDDDLFTVREEATDELEKIGKPAGPALRQALQVRHSAEVALRVKLLLDHLKGSIWTPDSLRRLRAVAVLEHIASPQAREVLQALAGEAAESGLGQEAKAALERLTRRPASTS